MATDSRSHRWTGLVVVAAVWAGLAEISPLRASPAPFQYGLPQEPVIPDFGFQDMPGDQDQTPGDVGTRRKGRGRSRSAATKKGRGARGDAAADGKTGKKAFGDTGESAAGKTQGNEAPAGIKFSRDIAPILVANCTGCHSKGRPGFTRGKLDLTTFAKLMEGTPKEKVIVAGKPDESHLVLRIKGEESPRMPQGGNRTLAEEAIARIEDWVKAGARLDSSIDPKATMESYAATPEQLRRAQLAKLSPKERERKVEAAGRERWKQANPQLKPELVPSEHFVIFSTLPKERASAVSKSMESQHAALRRLLGTPATDWVEKVGLYVFSNRKDLVEFARTVENRELDAEVQAFANLSLAEPYVAVVDPLGGKKEEPGAAKRRPRGKDKDAAAGGTRSLTGLLTENLVAGAVASLGKEPRWLSEGLGALMASQVEPRSAYFVKLRQLALEKYRQGWPTRANEALGEGQDATAEDIRAVGMAAVDFLLASDGRQDLPTFIERMSEGRQKLDGALKEVYGITREEFLSQTGDWVATRFGNDE